MSRSFRCEIGGFPDCFARWNENSLEFGNAVFSRLIPFLEKSFQPAGRGERWGAYNTLERDPFASTWKMYATHVRHGNMVLFSYVDGHAAPTRTNRGIYYRHLSYKEFTENIP